MKGNKYNCQSIPGDTVEISLNRIGSGRFVNILLNVERDEGYEIAAVNLNFEQAEEVIEQLQAIIDGKPYEGRGK